MTTEDTAPPGRVPPAAQAPYPPHPAPRPHAPPAPVPATTSARQATPAVGALGAVLIGGAVAAAVGLAFALPLWRRAEPAKRKGKGKRG